MEVFQYSCREHPDWKAMGESLQYYMHPHIIEVDSQVPYMLAVVLCERGTSVPAANVYYQHWLRGDKKDLTVEQMCRDMLRVAVEDQVLFNWPDPSAGQLARMANYLTGVLASHQGLRLPKREEDVE